MIFFSKMLYPKLFLIYVLGIFFLSIAPVNTKGSLNDIYIISIRGDYFFHALLFVPYTFLYIQAFRPEKWHIRLIMIISGLLMATFTEGIQYFLTYRSNNINDLMANWLGVFLGSAFVSTSTALLRKKTG